MRIHLLVPSILSELGGGGAVYGEIVLELHDRAAFDFAVVNYNFWGG